MLAALLPSVCFAAVPNKDAVPAYAEEQAIFQTEKRVPDSSWSSPKSGKVHIDRHYLGQYGATEGTVILQRGGNTWRKLRDGPIATLQQRLAAGGAAIDFRFLQLVGPARLEHAESGRQIRQWRRHAGRNSRMAVTLPARALSATCARWSAARIDDTNLLHKWHSTPMDASWVKGVFARMGAVE
ncbi:MAG: formate dehydrogenase subunit gamma [Herminiimonas sp.]|nr:formate dehydrogenase subunit gamma [Herminiimonas sp.]